MTGVHVVLVDDDEMMLRILQPRLGELALPRPVARIATALTPEAGLAAVDASGDAPLVVISDFNLKAPMDLLREVARRRPDAACILISGYAADQIGDVTAGGVIHGFVEKPLRVGEMMGPLSRIAAGALANAPP